MSDFAYFQEQDSEQFSFFRIPKILFSDERFRNLSSEAKILYGLMLDRVGLSRKNGWVDAEGNVYIHFTIEEMMSVLKWSRYRIFQLLDELDEKEPGIGLIERRRVTIPFSSSISCGVAAPTVLAGLASWLIFTPILCIS